MNIRLSYVSIVTPDLDALRDFYVDVVGLPEHVDWRHDGFRGLDAGGGVVLALHSPEAYAELGLPAVGAGSLVTFDPGDRVAVDAAHGRLTAAGVRVVREPFDTPYGSYQAVYLDREGNPFRINSF